TGPISMHCAPSGAMKRASDVPPPVLSSGGAPANSASTSRAAAQRNVEGEEQFAAAAPVLVVVELARQYCPIGLSVFRAGEARVEGHQANSAAATERQPGPQSSDRNNHGRK